MGGMAFIINVARAVSGFVKISRAFTRRETMLFPSSLISSRRRGNQPVYSSLARQSVFPFRTRALVRPFTGYLPRIKEDPFHPGMSQRGLHCTKVGRCNGHVKCVGMNAKPVPNPPFLSDNQTQHDNFHRCRSRSIRVDRSETDARDRSRKEDEDATGEEGEVNEGRAMTERRERERERDGGKTHSLWTLAVLDSSFGKRIIPWPSTAGAEKGARECKPFNGLCAGTLLRIPLAFFFLSFFQMNNRDRNRLYAHPRVCRVEDQRWDYRWREDEPYRFRIWESILC